MAIDTITFEQEVDKETGVVYWESYCLNGEYHRDSREGPAIIQRQDDGRITVESYFWRGKQHRHDGPAEIAYAPNGVVVDEIYYQHGVEDRDPKQGPAHIMRNPEGIVLMELYLVRGEPYRDPQDGPHTIERSETGEITRQCFLTIGPRRDFERPSASAPANPSP